MNQRPSYLQDVTEKPEARAQVVLDAVLKKPNSPIGARKFNPLLRSERKTILEEEKQAAALPPPEPIVVPEVVEIMGQSLEASLKDQPILSVMSDRDMVRLLIVTRDSSLTSHESIAKTRILRLSELFAEIHCIVLTVKGDVLSAPSRLSNNVWVYPTASSHGWRMVFDAQRIAKEQLQFVGGFRADIVLAEDPFESGVAGYLIAGKYDRPFEIHVFDDFYDPGFREMENHNDLRLIAARFVLPRADGIRTRSEYLQERLMRDYKKKKQRIEVLPVYYDLEAWKRTELRFQLVERYPQFQFILLHITNMKEAAHTDRVITGLARVLMQYPHVGLVVVGDGPQYDALQKQVVTLGLRAQVVFEGMVRDLTSHMKSAHALLHISDDPEEEVYLLQAAAVGLPIIANIAGIASELFLDGESAGLCALDHPSCLSDKVQFLMNRPDARVRFAQEAEASVFANVEQNYEEYLASYRDSILRGAFASD